MIILPIGEDSIPSPLHPPASKPAPLESTVRLLVFGFTPAERELIQGIVALSQRRSVRLQLVGGDSPDTADVILIDGADAKVMKWVNRGGLPKGKTLIQVDGTHTPAIALHLHRPVSWPSLPSLVLQALGLEATYSSRLPLSTF
jgi:two-component system cell cycle response regulator